jgi:hypothetical protein
LLELETTARYAAARLRPRPNRAVKAFLGLKDEEPRRFAPRLLSRG